MSKELIVKHNKLIEANYKLTLQEQKLILTLASIIRKEDKDFKKCVFTVDELSDILGLDKKGYYSELKEITKNLISRVIQIKENNKLLQVGWLSSAEYFENKGIVELEFSEKLKPYLLQLGKHFTKLEFKKLVSLSSVYAIRIYELCKQYEKIGERTIEIKELKKILGADEEKSYKIYNRFKDKVLKISQREINEKTDLKISYEEIKTSRAVTSIKIIIEKVNNKIVVDDTISEEEKEKNKEEYQETKERIKYNLQVEELFLLLPLNEQIESRKADLEKLLKQHSFEMLKADIEYCKKKNPKNFWAYFIKSTQEGHFSKADIEKEKKAEEIKKARQEKEEREKEELLQKEIELEKESEELAKYITKAEKKSILVNYRRLEKIYTEQNITFDKFVLIEIKTNQRRLEELREREKQIGYYINQHKKASESYTRLLREKKAEYEAEYEKLRPIEQKKYKSKKQYVIEKHRQYLYPNGVKLDDTLSQLLEHLEQGSN